MHIRESLLPVPETVALIGLAAVETRNKPSGLVGGRVTVLMKISVQSRKWIPEEEQPEVY